jgi:hypothetical protein
MKRSIREFVAGVVLSVFGRGTHVIIRRAAAIKLAAVVKEVHCSDGPMQVWDDASVRAVYNELIAALDGTR